MVIKARKQINEYKYKVFSWMSVITILLVILFLISSAGSLFSYFRSHQPMVMANAYIFLLAAIQFLINFLNGNYICDAGIFYWGHLYKWSSIEAYTWSPDNSYVMFKMKKFFGIENEAKFKIKECLRDDIRDYLNNYLGNEA
jgi:hypothetical protein